MVESQVEKYSLDCKSKKFSIKVCLLNNEKILFELTNKNGPEKYKAILSLDELKDLCFVFYSYETINESLIIIKNTIESGTIALEEKNNESKVELELNINLDSVDYPPFIINLLSEENNTKNVNVQTITPIYNYSGNKELEEKYENIDYDTTEVSSIVESKVQPKAMEVEYIQPILRLHYPDGSIKNTPLTPTLQGVDVNMTEEQLKNIREIITRDINKKGVTPIKENYKESSNTELNIDQDNSNKTMPSIRYINEENNLYEENDNNENDAIIPENIQKDENPETILENNDIALFQTPSPTLLVNDYKETRNYPTLTYMPKNTNILINTIEPTVSTYLKPNTYNTATVQSNLYQSSLYNTSTIQPNLYQSSLYNTASISVSPNTYVPQIQNPNQSIYQSSHLFGNQYYTQPYYQNQFIYPPSQISQLNQLLPQHQINNIGSQYYMNSYYKGVNSNLINSWNYPRKLFYYPKLK